MAKNKISYSCTSCTYKTIKWLGCCPECNEWDSFTEVQSIIPATPTARNNTSQATTMVNLNNVATTKTIRMLSHMDEWDRVMGGGIIPSSLIIVTGDPGIGKSTLLLQVCNQLAMHHSVFYFSTEESLQQVKLRAQRLACINDSLLFSDIADLDTIINTALQEKPDIVVIDSIQNCYIAGSQTLPGSTGQLREATFQLMRLAKEQNITIIITGHITKEGVIAGPKTL